VAEPLDVRDPLPTIAIVAGLRRRTQRPVGVPL